MARWQWITAIWSTLRRSCQPWTTMDRKKSRHPLSQVANGRMWTTIINRQIIRPEIKRILLSVIKINHSDWKQNRSRSISPTSPMEKRSYTEMWKFKLDKLSNRHLNMPGTIYSIWIGLRKSRWCNHTKWLCDGNSTVWKLDYMLILVICNNL